MGGAKILLLPRARAVDYKGMLDAEPDSIVQEARSMIPTLGLQARLGAMFMLVALVPYGVAMGFAFHVDGPSPEAVGICLVTLLPSTGLAFLLGQVVARWIYGAGAEHMQRYREERDRSERLAELTRLRSEFFASASHELRTPLSSLSMFFDTLVDNWDDLSELHRRDIIGRMRPICRRMNRLVADLLLAAEVQSGEMHARNEDVALGPIVHEACVEVAAVHPQVGIGVAGEPTCIVRGDPARVQQVLVNLLDNAAKFSPSDSTIRLEWETIEGSVMVRVQNCGISIPEGDLHDLFTPFKRAATGRHVAAGTGLGLHVCKRLVEAMDGHIWAESSGGRTVVSFSLLAGSNDTD